MKRVVRHSPAGWAAALLLLLLLSLYSRAHGAERLRVASGGFSVAHSPLWVGVETKTFQKHGLDVEYIMIDTGVVGGQALLSGEVQVLHSTGVLVIDANLKGADLTIIGGVENFLPYHLIARPEIKTPLELKGKRVAISSFGSASDFAARLALEKIRLDPNRDVVIQRIGGQNARYRALLANSVQATVFSEPLSTLMAKEQKMNVLADLAKLDIPFPSISLIVRRGYLQPHRSQMVNFMKAVIEAMHVLKTNRQLGIRTIQKYSRVQDPEEVGIVYDYFVMQHMGRIPDVPSRKAFETAIAMTVGQKKGITPEGLKVADGSILDEIIQSGFVDSLYKQPMEPKKKP